jgi:hypothetical protein
MQSTLEWLASVVVGVGNLKSWTEADDGVGKKVRYESDAEDDIEF